MRAISSKPTWAFSYVFTWGLMYVLSCIEIAYSIFWLFGVWLPWYASMIAGVFLPFTFPIWVVTWLLHFVLAVPFVHV